MTLQEFLNHWNLAENPFVGEEARTDRVFGKMIGDRPVSARSLAESLGPLATFHPDFDRILGDLHRPSSSVVFGEKGSGKTAVRLQIAARVRDYNADNPEAKILLVAYDDFDSFLQSIHARHAGKTPTDSFHKIRLVDHLDGIMQAVVSRLTDAMLGVESAAGQGEIGVSIGGDPRRTLRLLPELTRRDLLLLQALYDRPIDADLRTLMLRRRLGLGISAMSLVSRLLVVIIPLGLIAAYVWLFFFAEEARRDDERLRNLFYGATGAYLVFLLGFLIMAVFSVRQLGRRVRRQLAGTGRGFASFARSLALVDRKRRGEVPTSGDEDVRYALLDRLRRALVPLGYAGIVVVVDRVDEPTLVNGDVDRMRALIWPLFNNKLMQHEGLGLKLLLPVDLRHALFKESSSFFQEARLDKQGFVDRLGWSGSMLYDLCNARLKACSRSASIGLTGSLAGPPTVMDLFAEDVTRQDVVDALDAMHQPRDAFKFMYRCVAEHCSNVTAEQNLWRIPRYVLEFVKKQEVDRVQALYRGIRPA